MKPDFFIIGAARSGTTSLYAYLDQHPDIYFSQVKEINFFSNPSIWEKGLGWYERHFDGVRRGQIAGEASTSYTVSPFLDQAPRRIANYSPDAKIIYIVRDPIDRMISHYMHRVHHGSEGRHFSEVVSNLEEEPTAWQGRYYYQLQRYLEVFPRSQILVFSFDELRSSPGVVVRSIFDFLEVGGDVGLPEPDRVYNSSSDTLRRSGFGAKLLRFYRRYVEQKRLPYAFKKQFLNFAKIGSVRQEKPVLTDSEYQRLTQFYREDAAELARDFGINTSRWFTRR